MQKSEAVKNAIYRIAHALMDEISLKHRSTEVADETGMIASPVVYTLFMYSINQWPIPGKPFKIAGKIKLYPSSAVPENEVHVFSPIYSNVITIEIPQA